MQQDEVMAHVTGQVIAVYCTVLYAMRSTSYNIIYHDWLGLPFPSPCHCLLVVQEDPCMAFEGLYRTAVTVSPPLQ